MLQQITPKHKVKTRKNHRCFACGNTYEKGTEMNSQTNVFDGDIYTVYSCETCDEIMEEFEDLLIDESEFCFPEDCVKNAIHNYFSYDYIDKNDLRGIRDPKIIQKVLWDHIK